ncbi:MAG: ribose-5-phosphate isomerase RpiA [Myxococcaceae bacterium]
MSLSAEDQKRAAAERSVLDVRPGMVVGLGTGSTARFAILKLGERFAAGEVPGIVCIPTSEATSALARECKLPLAALADVPHVDIAVDGADEVDPDLDLIKGLGGALLREKRVAMRAERFVVFVDASKCVTQLGTRAPIPVEVSEGSVRIVEAALRELGAKPRLRLRDGKPFVTDNGNPILDAHLEVGVQNKVALARRLDALPGVLGHGLFLGLCHEVWIGGPNGLEHRKRPLR